MKKRIVLVTLFVLCLSLFFSETVMAWEYTCTADAADPAFSADGSHLFVKIDGIPNGSTFKFEFIMQAGSDRNRSVSFKTTPISVSDDLYTFTLPEDVRETFIIGERIAFSFKAHDTEFGNSYSPQSTCYCTYSPQTVVVTPNPPAVTQKPTAPPTATYPPTDTASDGRSLLPLAIILAVCAPVTAIVFTVLSKKHKGSK